MQHKNNFIISLEHAFKGNSTYFDHFGGLTPAGQAAFWFELDEQIRKFEKDESHFLPQVGALKGATTNAVNQQPTANRSNMQLDHHRSHKNPSHNRDDHS